MSDRSDEKLVEAYREGSDEAFGVLVGRYATELFSFMARFTGNPESAQDLVQETFMQVHLAANDFDVERRFKPWLFTIAANKARDLLRKHSRNKEIGLYTRVAGQDEECSLADLVHDETEPVESGLEAADLSEAVKEQIDRLPEHLRLVLMLSYYHGFPHKEISQMLSIPVGTVKSRLHSAVWTFADHWQNRQGGPELAQSAH